MTETLPQLITRRLAELDISARVAASPARSHGLISHALLSRHARGAGGKVSHRTAQGIALAIDTPLDQVLTAAGMPMTPGEFILPARAHLLTDKERTAVIAVIDAILATRSREPVPAKKTAKAARRSRG